MSDAAAASVMRVPGLIFWLRRYLPAEACATVAAVAAGLSVRVWHDATWITVWAATMADSIGFYAPMFVTIWHEERSEGRSPRTAIARGGAQLVAEFGPASLIDTFAARPALLALAMLLIPAEGWALLAGSLAANGVFYVVSAACYLLTRRARRDVGRSAPQTVVDT
ncbi:hypothetical protein [Microbacterium sp.]|uniref:hypothetical protein n=1 Tax=Microbacterium sp. TaxID=51671 RepID=UPI003C75D9E7